MLPRWATIILLLSFLVIGSGLGQFLHEAQHAREDRQELAAPLGAHKPVPAEHHHDESNCLICAQLHLPALPVAWVPLLISLGLLVAFVTMLVPRIGSQRSCFAIDCRGPPAC